MAMRVDYLPLPDLETASLIEQGARVSLKSHLRDIMKLYDVFWAPTSFLEGLVLPKEGRFFVV